MERKQGVVPFTRFMFIFSLVMSCLYILIGLSIVFAFIPIPGTDSLSPTQRQILGAVVLLYGSFRFYKAFQSYRNQKK